MLFCIYVVLFGVILVFDLFFFLTSSLFIFLFGFVECVFVFDCFIMIDFLVDLPVLNLLFFKFWS